MNLRPLSLTVTVLVALCVAVWFARRPPAPRSADPRVGTPVLAPDIAAQAARVKLADQGKTVELTRQPDGGWIVSSYHDFPADFAKLSRLITDLTGAKVRRLVTARADRLARLDFKDTSVALFDSGGRELWHATLGKNADGGGRYLRFGTEEKGYLADLTLWLDPEAKSWADPLLLELKAEDVARVEIGFADPTIPAMAFSRQKKDQEWTPASPTSAPEGKRLKAASITSLLANFADLRFTDTTAPNDPQAVAARAHGRMLKLTTFDQKTYTITFARKPEEKKPKPAASSAAAESVAATSDATTPEAEKPAEPEFETVPAGPVFVAIGVSEETARLNTLMQKRAFQVGDWIYTALPRAPEDLWEDVPVTPSSPTEGK